jgi:hypothetical protein
VVFFTWFFVDGFLFLVKELGLLTNPGHWIRESDIFWLQGDAFVVKGLDRDYDNPYYNGRSVVLIFSGEAKWK